MRKITRIGGAAIAILALGLTACTANNTSDSKTSSNAGSAGGQEKLSGTLNVGGASAQKAAQDAWIAAYKSVQPDVKVQYASVGSGKGITGLIGGQYNVTASDAALSDEEYEKTKTICGEGGAFNVPAYISPVAVITHIEGVDANLKLDGETIAKIFKGEITKWNDEAIAAHNEGVSLPDAKITVVHRADESGTTENFTKYLQAVAPNVWTDKPSKAWPVANQESAEKTPGVVSLVQQTKNSIGYADASAIQDLHSVEVKVGDKYVAYSPEAAAKTVSTSKLRGTGAPGDMAFNVDFNTKEDGAYPIIMVSYEIFCTQYADSNIAALAKSYGKYVVSQEGQAKSAEAAGSAPLSEALSKQAQELIDTIK